jgi:hypothetical protein
MPKLTHHKKTILNHLTKNVELSITSLVALICLFLFSLFQRNNLLETFTIILSFFFLIPTFYLKFILKKDLQSFGWQVGNFRAGIFWSIVSFLISASLGYIIIYHFRLPEQYQIHFINNFWFFLIYEVLVIGLYLALYEFFFRGFLMFSFENKLGRLTPFFPFLVFALFYWVTGNFIWQSTFFLLTAFFSGWITFKSRSIIYSIVYSTLFIIIADTAIIYIMR